MNFKRRGTYFFSYNILFHFLFCFFLFFLSELNKKKNSQDSTQLDSTKPDTIIPKDCRHLTVKLLTTFFSFNICLMSTYNNNNNNCDSKRNKKYDDKVKWFKLSSAVLSVVVQLRNKENEFFAISFFLHLYEHLYSHITNTKRERERKRE